jgi:hypothetical protein
MKEMGTNPTVNDSTSNANNSTAQTWTPGSGLIDGGGVFATNTHIDFANNATYPEASDFTMSAWIKSSQTGNLLSYIIYKGDTQNEPLSFYLNNGLLMVEYYKNGVCDYYAKGSTDLRNGAWHHVVATRSGSSFNVYVDGINARATGADGSATFTTSTSFRIGSRNNNDLYFNGSIDEVRISNTARSANWIKTEYNNQSSPSTFYSISVRQISAATSLSSWSYRKAIKIDHTKISGTNNLKNFPVLINLAAEERYGYPVYVLVSQLECGNRKRSARS